MNTPFTTLRCVLCCGGVLLAGCGPSGSSQQGSSDPGAVEVRGSGSGGGERQRQADFLNRIRQSDPQYQTIEKAVLNENNELGLILSRNVQMDSIPTLMRALLTQMTKEFPGQDLTVVAYAPTEPPARIGTGRLDIRSGQMSYKPEH